MQMLEQSYGWRRSRSVSEILKGYRVLCIDRMTEYGCDYAFGTTFPTGGDFTGDLCRTASTSSKTPKDDRTEFGTLVAGVVLPCTGGAGFSFTRSDQ